MIWSSTLRLKSDTLSPVSTRTVSLTPDTIKLTVGRPLTSLVTPEAQPRFPTAENVCCAVDKHEHNVQFSHNGNTISSGGRRHGARVCRSHCQAVQTIVSHQDIIPSSFRTVRTRQRITHIVLPEDLRFDHNVALLVEAHT